MPSVMRLRARPIIIGLAVLLALLIAGLPWAFYWYSMSLVDGRPVPPTRNISSGEVEAVWTAQEGSLSRDRVRDITPYWFYHWLLCAFELKKCLGNEPYENMSRMASYIALSYLRNGHFKGRGMGQWHPAHANLSIWIQRNMSPEDIVAAYLDAKSRITPHSTGAPNSSAVGSP